MRVSIEKVDEELLKSIRKLDVENYKECVVGIDWYKDRYKKLEYVAVARSTRGKIIGYEIITGIDKKVFKCYEESLLCGDVSLAPKAYLPINNSNCLYLAMMCVSSKYRESGIATKMTEVLLEEVKKNKLGVYKIVAVCTNEVAEKVLKNNGFRVIGRIGDRSIMWRGCGDDAVRNKERVIFESRK